MIDYKFNEKDLIKEFQTYVDTTYDGHYSKDKFQATEFIIDGGHGTGFCIGCHRRNEEGESEWIQKIGKVEHSTGLRAHLHFQMCR